MPMSVSFLLADYQREGTVHLQGAHCGPSSRGQADNSETVPFEVSAPRVTSWMKQTHQFSGLRVHHFLSCSFPQRAGHAGQREIIECRLATRCDGHNVVYMEERLLTRLGQPAILAAVARPFHDLPPQTGRDGHAASPPSRSARARSTDSNSAKSTNPSAS